MNPNEAKNLALMFIDGLEREQKTTRRVVAAIPDDQLNFKLGEQGRTTLELAWHLLASEAWFAEGIVACDFNRPELPMPDNPNVAALLSFYDSEFPGNFAKLRAMPGDDLIRVVSFFGAMQLPNVTYLGFWNSHSVHHRGQLSAYLRAMNAHVPSIYGGSFDEPFQVPATA
jgi:uncharacterized damage-inducible protein DinB